MDDLLPLAPLLMLAAGGLLVLLLVGSRAALPAVAPIAQTGPRNGLLAGVSLGVLALAAILSVHYWVTHPSVFHESFFGGALVIDNFSAYFTVLSTICGIVTIATIPSYSKREGMDHGELYALLIFAVFGMVLLAAGNDLIVLFLGIETMSLAVYALVGLRRRDPKANEATLKYVLLGAFSSAILLYGIALVYGAAGSTRLDLIGDIQRASPGANYTLYLVGLVLLLVGLAFKVGAVPFHMWVPDVYQGAAAPITGFMATAVKAAGFAMFVRVMLVAFSGLAADWSGILWWLAAFSMFGGNVLALAQRNLKRMLAYSSIAHTGYLLVGFAAISRENGAGATAILVYLAAYALTNLGAFACITFLSAKDDRGTDLPDWAGVGRKHPWIAAAMAICMLSLIGFPPTAGFLGKYLLFTAAIQAGQTPLAVIAIINSILSIWYYLRVIVVMTMGRSEAEASMPGYFQGAAAGAIYAAIAVVWAGIGTFSLLLVFPGAQSLLNWARLSVDSLF